MHVASPDEVTMLPLFKKRQHDKYPSCPASSLEARVTAPISLVT